MSLSRSVVLSALLGSSAAHAAPCTHAVELRADDAVAAELTAELQMLGVSTGSPSDCEAPVVDVSQTPEAVEVQIRSTYTETRSLPAVRAAAVFVESRVRTDRYADMLTVDDDGRVDLYATFEDWKARRVTGTVEVEVLPDNVARSTPTNAELTTLHALDLSIKEAKPHGKVFGVEVDGRFYLNDDTPRPNRTQSYGLFLEVQGHGMFEHRDCHWLPANQSTPGRMQCDVWVKLLDLETGETRRVGKKLLKKWLDVDPTLKAAFVAERPKHASTVQRYLADMLEAHPGMDLD